MVHCFLLEFLDNRHGHSVRVPKRFKNDGSVPVVILPAYRFKNSTYCVLSIFREQLPKGVHRP